MSSYIYRLSHRTNEARELLAYSCRPFASPPPFPPSEGRHADWLPSVTRAVVLAASNPCALERIIQFSKDFLFAYGPQFPCVGVRCPDSSSTDSTSGTICLRWSVFLMTGNSCLPSWTLQGIRCNNAESSNGLYSKYMKIIRAACPGSRVDGLAE